MGPAKSLFYKKDEETTRHCPSHVRGQLRLRPIAPGHSHVRNESFGSHRCNTLVVSYALSTLPDLGTVSSALVTCLPRRGGAATALLCRCICTRSAAQPGAQHHTTPHPGAN